MSTQIESMTGGVPEERDGPTPASPVADERTYVSHSGLLVLGLGAFGLFLLALTDTSRDGPWGPATTAAIAWAAFAFHLAAARRYLSAFDPAVWIPVMMLFHYFGMPVAVELLAPHMFPEYNAWGLGEPPKLSQGFVVALLAMVSFLFGMHLAGWKRLGLPPPSAPPDDPRTTRAAWGLLLLALFMTIVGIPIAGGDLVFGKYHDLKMAQKLGSADLRFFFTGTLLATIGIAALLACHQRDRPGRMRFAIGSAALVTVLLLATGDRGGLSGLVFAGGWAYSQRVRRAPWTITVSGYLAALLVMPMIGEFREQKSIEDSQQHTATELAAATFMEMGSSVAVFGYSLEHIPRDKAYVWGMSFVAAVVNNIPNVTLTQGTIFGTSIDYNPGQWVTLVANPHKWRTNRGGYAYAIGAEWFFNFGMPGVYLGMTLMGWAMGWLRNQSRRSSMWLIVSAAFLVLLSMTIRNAISFPLRTFLWPLALLWLIRVCVPGPRRPAPLLDQSAGHPGMSARI